MVWGWAVLSWDKHSQGFFQRKLISSFTLSPTHQTDTEFPVTKPCKGNRRSKICTNPDTSSQRGISNGTFRCSSSCFSNCKHNSLKSITALLLEQNLSLATQNSAVYVSTDTGERQADTTSWCVLMHAVQSVINAQDVGGFALSLCHK